MNILPKSKFNSFYIFRPHGKLFKRALNPMTIKKLRNFCKDLTSKEFTGCWNAYDRNRNGFLEGDEIKDFLSDLLIRALREKKVNDKELRNLQEEFMSEFDLNKDGKIEIAEIAQILEPEENFLALIRYEEPMMDGYDFIKAWMKFADHKDTIETSEIKNFLRYLYLLKQKAVPEDKLNEYSQALVDLYDKNGDGILSFKEMSRIISPEENYLIKFKEDYVLSYKTFSEIFGHYDKDKSGEICGQELVAFIRDILQTINADATESAEEIEKFRRIVLKMCDRNKDGILQKEEKIGNLLESFDSSYRSIHYYTWRVKRISND